MHSSLPIKQDLKFIEVLPIKKSIYNCEPYLVYIYLVLLT